MQFLSLVYWLLRRRLRHSWVLLAVTSFGILASVTIMSTGALYSRALEESGLRHMLATFSPQVHNAQITARNRPLARPAYLPLQSLVQEVSNERLGEMLRGDERRGTVISNLTMLNTPASPDPSGRPFFLTGFTEHTNLIAGRWPDIENPENQDDIETVIGVGTAAQLGFGLGDRVVLVPRRGSADRLFLKVVGLAEPIDAREEYWFGAPAYFDTITVGSAGDSVVVPLYVTEEAFFQGIGARYPTLVGNFVFYLFLDAGHIDAGNAGVVQRQILGLETDLNKQYPRTLVASRLGRTIDEFNRALTLAKVPLFLYLSLVVVVVLYFLVLITGSLGRSQAEEAGLLSSRGASVLHIGGVLAMAEGFVVLISMIAGPFLAWAIVKFMLLDTINTGGAFDGPVPLGLAGDMFWMGAWGGVLAMSVLLATAVGRARMGTLESLMIRARPPSVPFLHRYYLDIFAVAAAAVIWFQIRGRDGFVAEELSSEGLNIDPTLVLGPVIGLFAAAILLLRVLPLVVRFLAWAGTRIGAAWFQFSILRLARDPIPHGSLAIILMLAAALGVFGATFQSSLSQAQSDQARYRVGGDMVVKGQAVPADASEILRTIPGVTAVSPVFRESVSMVEGRLGERVQLLAMEPGALAEAAWFRDDFFPGGLQEIRKLLQPEPISSRFSGTEIPLPEDSVSLGVWVDSSVLDKLDLRAGLNLWARVMTATGRYSNIPMGIILESNAPNPSDAKATYGPWRLFTGELPVAGAPASLPIELVSLFITTGATRLSDGVLHLDDITVFGPSTGPDGLVVEGFEEPVPWAPLANHGEISDVAQRSTSNFRSGTTGLQFSWREPLTSGQRGIHLPPGPFPIPAIGGPDFRVGQQMRVTLNHLAVPVQIVGVVSHFPTLDPGRDSFIIVDLPDYMQTGGRSPPGYQNCSPGWSPSGTGRPWRISPNRTR